MITFFGKLTPLKHDLSGWWLRQVDVWGFICRKVEAPEKEKNHCIIALMELYYI